MIGKALSDTGRALLCDQIRLDRALATLTFAADYVLILFMRGPAHPFTFDRDPSPDWGPPREPDDDLDDAEEDAAKLRAAERFAMLRELAETGMEMARALRLEARAVVEAEPVGGEPPRSVADLVLAFSRVARAVRQTLALETRLETGLEQARQAKASSDHMSRSQFEGAAARVRDMIARIAGLDDEDDDQPD